MGRETFLRIILVMFLCVNLAVPPGLMAQGANQDAGEKASLRPEEIDQMVAPIALYPDSLLAQLLTASTYPLEIVQAARFVQQNKDLKGEKLMEAAKDKDWDPSVKAMLQFPDVLAMMNEKIEWTGKLGDAFLDQQQDVMDSVQRLRRKADESGNLKTTKEQKVIVEKETKVIVIEPASPQVVYVPAYNPTVVYGVWPYPAYPPYYYYPPGYVAGAALFSFGVGVAIGAAWGGWGGWNCGWHKHGGSVNVNVNRYNSFTKNTYVNANKYQLNQNIKNQTWQHNPQHRGGAQYRNQVTAQKYGQQRSGTGARPTTSEARGYGGGASERGGGRPQSSNISPGKGRESALSGAGKGGSERASSFRGQESRSSVSRSGSASPGSGGASRSSGGASRSSGGASRGGGGRR